MAYEIKIVIQCNLVTPDSMHVLELLFSHLGCDVICFIFQLQHNLHKN